MKKRLQAGEHLFGAFLNLRSPDAAELMSGTGFDFLLVDTEHSSLGPDGVLELIRAVGSGKATPLVRVSDIGPSHVQWALDAGAGGVLFPRVRSIDDVRTAVALCRYPPDGRRGLGPGRASGYGARIPEYLEHANRDILVMVQIETLEAVEHVSDIVGVPGVDLLFIGPGDLSHAMGLTGRIDHPDVRAVIERIVRAGESQGVPVGSMVLDEKSLPFWLGLGVQLLALGSDATLLIRSSRQVLERAREAAAGTG